LRGRDERPRARPGNDQYLSPLARLPDVGLSREVRAPVRDRPRDVRTIGLVLAWWCTVSVVSSALWSVMRTIDKRRRARWERQRGSRPVSTLVVEHVFDWWVEPMDRRR